MKSVGKMTRLFLWIMVVLGSTSVQAQKLTVSKMAADPNDNSASQYVVKDLNGDACALVKVSLPIEGVSFEGNVIGTPQYKEKEYWVYMTSGSKELRIKHGSFQPCHVNFSDYGIRRVLAKTTYRLTVQLPKQEDDKEANAQHYLVLTVSPANSLVSVDGQLYAVGADGKTNICLTKGQHTYRVEAPGYTTEEKTVDISEATIVRNVRLLPAESTSTASIQTYTVNGVSFNMVSVESGTFTPGKIADNDAESSRNTQPTTLRAFSIGESEVTQALWKAVMGDNPSLHKGDDLPVDNVTWDDCQIFVWQLSEITGKPFRLPTVNEWEFAARGGNKSQRTRYAGSGNLSDVAWYADNSNQQSHPVKARRPNELGLYDMSGNVSEWCDDQVGELSSKYNICVGGGWKSEAKDCLVTSQDWINRDKRAGVRLPETYGLRLAL